MSDQDRLEAARKRYSELKKKKGISTTKSSSESGPVKPVNYSSSDNVELPENESAPEPVTETTNENVNEPSESKSVLQSGADNGVTKGEALVVKKQLGASVHEQDKVPVKESTVVQSENIMLKKENSKLKSQIESMEGDLASLRAELTSRKEHELILETNAEELKSKQSQMIEESRLFLEEKKTQTLHIEELDKEVSLLKARLEEQGKTMEETTNSMLTIDSAKRNLENDFSTLQNKTADLQSMHSTQSLRFQETQSKLAQLQLENRDLVYKLSETRSQLAQLKDEKKHLVDKHEADSKKRSIDQPDNGDYMDETLLHERIRILESQLKTERMKVSQHGDSVGDENAHIRQISRGQMGARRNQEKLREMISRGETVLMDLSSLGGCSRCIGDIVLI